jgi:hypothetical protein
MKRRLAQCEKPEINATARRAACPVEMGDPFADQSQKI